MKLIARGAEANIYLDGENIIKERVKKSYRIPELDLKLRLSRTKREAKLLSLAKKAGVPAPFVRDVIPEEFTLVMSYIPGDKLRDVVSEVDIREVFTLAGEIAAKLHANHIIHGDLTTSNMLLSGGRLYLIDFGLGEVTESTEAKGTDLLVFKKSVHATHAEFEKEIFDAFFSGYSKVYSGADRVLERLRIIEKRGRYFSDRA